MKKFKYKSIPAIALSILLTVQMIPAVPAAAEVLTNDRYVYEFLTEELELPHASASGLMANIDQECAFLPTASCVDTNGQISYGLMQWNGPRFEQLKRFCESNGYAYDTLEGQLAFLEYDLNGPYRGYYDYLLFDVENSEQGAYDAAYFWAAWYEVCSSSYFEVRADLARDYYYPAYLEYAPASAVVFEKDFYALLGNAETGMVLADEGQKLKMQKKTDASNQIWHFVRQSGDTYTAVNCATGRKLSPESGNSAGWLFYETGSGYMLKQAGTENVLGCSEDNAVQLQVGGGSGWQSFQLSVVKPAATSKLNVKYEAAPSEAVFSWEAAAETDSYRLKVYSGETVQGLPYASAECGKELKWELVLPAGTYTAVLESVNECGVFSADPVTFTIQQQKPVDLGKEFYAKISWLDGMQYLTRTEEADVHSSAADYQEDQLWQFVRNEDGSYQIYAGQEQESALILEEKEAVALEKMDEKKISSQSWVIYGSEEKGYVLQSAAQELVLSVAEGNDFEAREFAEVTGQRFEIADYAFEAPVVTADASGGVLEPVHFTWNESDCAEGYLLEVKNAEGLVAATIQIRDRASQADVTLHEGEYTAVVSAVSGVTGERKVSESVSFSVKNLPERPAVGLEISEEAGGVSFYWNRCMDADSYSYRICDAATGEVVVQKENAKGFAAEEELSKGRYILTVTAKNDEGTIPSAEVTLDVRENAPGESDVSLKSILAARKLYLETEGKE